MTQGSSRPALNHFAVLHWGPGGKGTGYTIVTARDTNMARNYVWLHLSSKEDGHRQCGCRTLLEVNPLDESIFAHLELPQKVGVHCEYHLADDEEAQAPTLIYQSNL